MRIHRDILAGLLCCLSTKQADPPTYRNLAISADGTKMYAANGHVLGVGDLLEPEASLANAIVDANDVTQFMRNLKRSRAVYIQLDVNWDTRDGKPSLAGWVPIGIGIAKMNIAVLHDAPRFPDPTAIIEASAPDPSKSNSRLAIGYKEHAIVQKALKTFTFTYVYAPPAVNVPSWWIGKASAESELRLMVMPSHPGVWPA